MNIALKERLDSHNISDNDILAELNTSRNCSVILYTSQMDGLGSGDSDIDVYVICEDSLELISKFGRMFILEGLEFDVEYHNIAEIIDFFDSYDGGAVPLSVLSFLLRLLTGNVIFNSFPLDKKIKNLVSRDKLEEIGLETYLILALSEYDDALKMYNQADYISGMPLARTALNYLTMAMNIANNDYVFKTKWAYRLLKRVYGMEHEYVKNYQKYTLDEVSKPDEFLEDMLSYIQNMITKLRLWDGASEI